MTDLEPCRACSSSHPVDEMWPINLHATRFLCNDCYEQCGWCERRDVPMHERGDSGAVCVDCFLERGIDELLGGQLTSEQRRLIVRIKTCLVEQKGRRNAA